MLFNRWMDDLNKLHMQNAVLVRYEELNFNIFMKIDVLSCM